LPCPGRSASGALGTARTEAAGADDATEHPARNGRATARIPQRATSGETAMSALDQLQPLILPLAACTRMVVAADFAAGTGLRHSGEAALKVSFLQELEGLAGRRARAHLPGWRRQLPFIAIWLLLLMAAARPQWLGEPLPVAASGRDLLVAVDVSGSMDYPDMMWKNDEVSRLALVKTLLGDFLEHRQGDRIGLILFGSQAYLQAPLTFDRKTVRVWLDEARIGIAGKNTAIGDAIGLALKRLRQRPAQSRVLILVTDGANNAGQIDPRTAARLAASEGVKIYPIVLPGAQRRRTGRHWQGAGPAGACRATTDPGAPCPLAVSLAAGNGAAAEPFAGDPGTLAEQRAVSLVCLRPGVCAGRALASTRAAPAEAPMMEFLASLWPHWLRPGWLLLLPLLGWLLWRLWNRQKRVGRWQMILPSAFHSALLSGGGGRESKLPWIVLGISWLLAVLALLGPSWQRVEQNSQRPVDPLVVMLELTPEMLAADSPPTRLEQARRKLLDLLQARSDSQTAIIVYAGSAHTLVPLSDDLATSKNLLDAIRPSIMPEAGQRADLAVRKALDLLEQGDLGQGRLLWIGSSLSEAERQGIRAAMTGRDAPALLMLGVGTAEGAPVTQEKGGFLKDAQGGILVPRLDGPVLKDFADSMAGRYTALRLDNQDLNDLGLLDGPKSLISEGQKVRLDRWADQGYWLLLPLLLLAGCAGRRGWLLCLPLLLMTVPQASYAFDFQDLWRRPDQQGERLLKRHHPAEAARHFQDPRWQGVALYQAGDYAGAAQRFAQGSSAVDHYNRGNALARSGELEGAIDAYAQALDRQPDFPAALANKALVEQVLELNKT
nr:hypothetical protein [Tanacetum cinerariifolium]